MKMRQISSALLLILGLAACGQSNDNQANQATQTETPKANTAAPSTPANTSSGTVYRVGTDAIYQPYNFRDIHGNVSGLDIDVLNAIAKNQGFTVEYVPIKYEILLNNWKSQNIDIITNGLAFNNIKEDANLVASNPYMFSGDCIAARKQEDFNQWHQKRVITITDDYIDDDLISEHHIKKEQIQQVKTLFLGLKALLQGKGDIFVSDCTAIRYNAMADTFKNHPFAIKQINDQTDVAQTGLIFAINKDKPELVNKINAGLKNLRENGDLEKMVTKWGGEIH